MKRIVSGITSTGRLTLGNYIGAIKQFQQLEKDNQLIIFVADLHAITLPISRLVLKNNIHDIVALYYACDLINNQNIVFVQSDVLEHTQLAWILACHTTLGELNRMTQFKDKAVNLKAGNNTSYIPTGLLTYPTLMAADILLYNADLVPIGKDQKQHIELTRNIAKRMNGIYGKIFTIPQEYMPKQGAKIMDLQNPTKKMSKSSTNGKTYISLLDTPGEVTKKIKAAVTDSENKVYYNKKYKPGVSNLMTIYAALEDKTLKEVEMEFKHKNYGEFKNAIIKVINNLLKNIQDKYYEVLKTNKIEQLLEIGANKARKIANATLEKLQKKIGISYK